MAEARNWARARSRSRGHFDHDREATELRDDEVAKPVAGGWPLLEVDTAGLVDVTSVARRVEAAQWRTERTSVRLLTLRRRRTRRWLRSPVPHSLLHEGSWVALERTLVSVPPDNRHCEPRPKHQDCN